VLQHLSKNECKDVLSEINRTLTIGGRSLIQMPNVFGIRSSYHLLKRGYRQGNGFEVRYYTPGELVKNFRSAIGETRVFVDGFFGLGVQASDIRLMRTTGKIVIRASEFLKSVARVIPGFYYFADSLFLDSTKSSQH